MYDFPTLTLAYFNRYPNPHSAHVLSTDTISTHIDAEGRLHQTKLIKKSGRLPTWVKPFLGKISTSWIIEITMVDPKRRKLWTYCRNLDHTKVIRVEEFNEYIYKDGKMESNVKVKFSSGFKHKWAGTVKDRIEAWSQKKFRDNIEKSRMGFKLVMDGVKERLMHQGIA